MMSNTEAGAPIVVGVDGSEDSLRALDWAAAEAARHGWPLRLVYAHPPSDTLRPAVDALRTDPSGQDSRLSAAQDHVAREFPGLSLSTVEREGPAPRVLLEESEQARMLVVGREGLNRFGQSVLGSVSLACATNARVPVAVIPMAWDPPKKPYGRVLLGVDGSEKCQAATHYAFQAAADRGAELVVVYAWHRPTGHPERWQLDTEDPDVKAHFRRILADSIGRWQDKYPDVAVTAVDEVNHPAMALGRHAVTADLVVIGGRGHGTVTGASLGSIALAVLRHIDRPIVVVHQP